MTESELTAALIEGVPGVRGVAFRPILDGAGQVARLQLSWWAKLVLLPVWGKTLEKARAVLNANGGEMILLEVW